MALCEVVVCGSSLLWPRVLFFGDSTTQFSFQQAGWGAPLADKLVSALKGENPKQRIPLEEYAANLTSTVQHLQSVGVPKSRLIRTTPLPPLCEAAQRQERVSS